MTKKQKRNSEVLKKWYYDACALDYSKVIIHEITRNKKRHKTIAVTSHLALSEALANCRIKKGIEQAQAFVGLINELYPDSLKLIENDGIDDILQNVRCSFTRLSLTDAIHLVTAIKYKCVNLRTSDRDLYGFGKKEIRGFAVENGCSEFVITELE